MRIEDIRTLLISAERREVEEILNSPEEKFPFSENFTLKMNELIASQRTKYSSVKRKIYVAVIAAMLIIASAVTAFAYREKLLDFFERREKTHTSLSSPGGENANKEIKEVFLPAYIPEKFQLESYDTSHIFVVSIWSDGVNIIRFKQTPIMENDRTLDTENGNYTVAVFGNQPVYYIVKYNTFNAVWHTEDYVFNFSAPYDLGLEEIEKIITSIALDG